jgi:hypothetical protein
MTLELSTTEKSALWRSGFLAWKLHSSQLEVYLQYRAWAKDSFEKRKDGVEVPGVFPRVFLLDISRRWGKDYLSLCLAIEDALKRPGSILTYATAYGKDLNELVLPLVDLITEDCPDNVRPVYKTTHQGTANGLYFPNKSVIKLVGVEARPDSLRGRFSDGYYFSEAGFIGKLDEALVRVVTPQLQGRLHANILINSTPPVNPATWYDTELCPDAVERRAYVKKTIFDNPRLSVSERNEFIRAAGGLDSENCKREYLCERIRSATATVVPEFSRKTNVSSTETPPFAHGFTVIDPGVRDMCAVVTGWYDFERAKLVIRRSWQRRNANTNQVVAAVRELEDATFRDLKYWTNKGFQSNPVKRFADTEARLILDLNSIYDMKVIGVDKTAGKLAALQRFRTGIQTGAIEFHPDAEEAIGSVEAAVWNKERSDWAKSANFGHYDALDACIYANLSVNRIDNPFPPSGVVLSQNVRFEDLVLPDHTLTRKQALSDKWKGIFGSRRHKTVGRR